MKRLAAIALAVAAPMTMGAGMTHHAMGNFEVKMTPNSPAGAAVSGMAIDKNFYGGLEAHSLGQMLSAGNPASGSAGYVAIEQVTGTLDGKPGAFALQHSGTMDKGAQSLSVTVVPGSGTGALVGLAGAMTIKIEGGEHFYTFDYTLL